MININNLPDKKLETISKLSDDDLIKYMAGWKPDSEDRIKAEWVLWKRKNRWTAYRAWLSIVIAVFSILLSLWSAFGKTP